MFYFGYIFLDDVDYLVVIVSYFIHRDSSPVEMRSAHIHLAPCQDHPTLTCIALHLGHLTLPLMCVHTHHTSSQENEVVPEEQEETPE